MYEAELGDAVMDAVSIEGNGAGGGLPTLGLDDVGQGGAGDLSEPDEAELQGLTIKEILDIRHRAHAKSKTNRRRKRGPQAAITVWMWLIALCNCMS